MAITLDNDGPSIDAVGSAGPGGRLKDARVAKKLEIEDIANRLRLHVRTIRDIEADDYEQLPAPTFVRGYLRGYARIVELSPEEVVESYDRNDFAPPALVPDISSGEETKSSDFPVRLTTYVVLGVLFLLVVLWWQSGEESTPARSNAAFDTPSLDAEPTDLDVTPAAGEAAVNIGENGVGVPGQTPGSGTMDDLDVGAVETVTGIAADGLQQTVDALSQATEELADAASPAVISETLVEETAVDTPASEVAAPEVSVVEAADVVAASDPEATTANELTATSDQPIPRQSPARVSQGDTVSLTLSKESWLEIYNADNKRMYYDLARAGADINISDTGPFRMIIGYAEGAVLRYNGELVDLAPHTFEGVAKLTLGESTRN